MSGGAGLPIDSATDVLGALRRIESDHSESLEGPAMIALSIIRACLAAGAADHITYAAPQPAPRKLRLKPRWPGSKRRRR